MEPIAAETRAGAGVRCVARIVDGFVLVVPLLLIALVTSGKALIVFGTGSRSDWASSVLSVLLAYAYFVWCESARGATIGKSAFNITVVGPEGRPTIEQSARRNAFMLLAILPGGLGGFVSFVVEIVIIVSIARDPRGQGIHDRYAGVFLTRT